MSSSSTGSSSQDTNIQNIPGPAYKGMEAMEEDLMCPICRDMFEDPQLLSCAHTLCKDCLEGLIQSSVRRFMPLVVKCPICREQIVLQGTDGPKTNHLLKEIIGNYRKMQALPRPPVCKVHAEQPNNMYCVTDMKLICGVCATSEEHKQHAFSSIADACNHEKDSLPDLILGLEKTHDSLSLRQTLETNKAETLQVLSVDAEKLREYFAKLKEELEQRETKLLSEVEGMMAAVMQTYDPEITKLDALFTEQEKAQQMARDCQDISDPYLFLKRMQEVREKIGSIKKVTKPAVPDDPVSPAMKTFDPSMWNNMKLMDVNRLELPSRNPTKTQKSWSKPSCSVWAVFVGLLLLTSVMAFYSSSFSDDQVTFNDYISPVSSYLEDVSGEALDRISVYSRLIAGEIYDTAGRCWVNISHIVQQVALSVSSFIWKEPQQKILYLDMEERTTPVPRITKPTLSQSRELQMTSYGDHYLAVYQYVHGAGSYLTTVIIETAGHVSAYWWFVVQEMLALSERCGVYVMAFVEQMAGFN